MDDHITGNTQSVYLASLTQSKKIQFLQRELSASEHYIKNLQQDLQSTKLTINRLIKQRTNHEILSKMSQNIYNMQRRCREMQEQIKENNAKLLIQMQLRVQQKNQYSERIRQMEEQIQLIRKTNKDKEQEFTIIVNKLRKYEDIRELTLQQKLKDNKKMLTIRDDDKQAIIKELGVQIQRLKKTVRQGQSSQQQQLDKIISIMQYAVESQANYQNLKDQLKYVMMKKGKKSNTQQILMDKIVKKQSLVPNNQKLTNQNKKSANSGVTQSQLTNLNLNDSTKELIKQLKKLSIYNKLLEAALNQSIEKNKQLIINNEILVQANLTLKQEIQEYRKKQFNFLRKKKKSEESVEQKNKEKSKQLRRSDTFRSSNSRQLNYNFGLTPQKHPYQYQHQDDMLISLQSNISSPNSQKFSNIPQLVRERKLKQYLQTLKSKNYEVNTESLYRDVHRMAQFLILALGSRSKDIQIQGLNNGAIPSKEKSSPQKDKSKVTYSKIIQKESERNKVKSSRSISVDLKQSKQKSMQQIDNDIKNKAVMSTRQMGLNTKVKQRQVASSKNLNATPFQNRNMKRQATKKQDDNQNFQLKSEDQQINIEQI